jgi:hypothetical protein
MRHYFSAAKPRLALRWRRRRTLEPASPDTGPSGRHAYADPAGFAASAGPRRATSGGVPVRRNRHRSRSDRDRSSCTRRPDSCTARTRTDCQTPGPGRSARHRRRGVDERRPRQDTRPACVLPGTMRGTASGQNCQVEFGAVLTLNSARPPPDCRCARCTGYPRGRNIAPDHVSAGVRTCRHSARAAGAKTPDGAVPRSGQGAARQPPPTIGTPGTKSVGQLR